MSKKTRMAIASALVLGTLVAGNVQSAPAAEAGAYWRPVQIICPSGRSAELRLVVTGSGTQPVGYGSTSSQSSFTHYPWMLKAGTHYRNPGLRVLWFQVWASSSTNVTSWSYRCVLQN
jgi:hypothetical protein